MAKLHDDWTILPHGPLRELEPGLLTVTGQIPMPIGNFPRRMTVIALEGGKVALYSPIALEEEAMARIEALGEIAWLIVPSAAHRLDSRPFHKRYPDARIVTATGAREGVAEAVPVDGTTADLGPTAELIPVAGAKQSEVAVLVRHEGGCSLVTNDVIGNVSRPQGIGAWIMSRLTGFGPRAQVPRLIRLNFIDDPKALANQLRQWAAMPGLCRLIPCHGEVIDNPAAELSRIAAQLDR